MNENPNSQNIKLIIAKLCVLILTCLIFMVGGAIILKATAGQPVNKKEAINNTNKEIELPLEKDSKVDNIFACGKYICINIENDKEQKKILIIDPEKLSETKTVKLY